MEQKSAVLVVFDPGRDLWYLNHDGFQYSCNICWPELHDSAGAPQWINTIQAFDQRISEYSASSLMTRTGKDAKHTKKLIGFLLQVDKDHCDEDNLKSVLNPIVSFFQQQHAVRYKNSAGTILWS